MQYCCSSYVAVRRNFVKIINYSKSSFVTYVGKLVSRYFSSSNPCDLRDTRVSTCMLVSSVSPPLLFSQFAFDNTFNLLHFV
jgi:hypothetical protein